MWPIGIETPLLSAKCWLLPTKVQSENSSGIWGLRGQCGLKEREEGRGSKADSGVENKGSKPV